MGGKRFLGRGLRPVETITGPVTETVRTCPECGSTDLVPEAGFMTGYKYHCQACDYVGALVIEQEIERSDTSDEDG